MSPRVTVVTSVFNGAPYIDRALPSILNQTYRDFEYLIVDDGSTDGTGALLEKVAAADPRVRIMQPGRIGFARALNLAIEQASGEYIARQDFDDASRPERLERQVDFLDAHPRVGVVGSHYTVVDDTRGERYVRRPPTGHQDLVRTLPKYIPFAHTLATFRKQAWVEVGGYPEVDDIEDLRMWTSFAAAGWRLANVPEVLGEHWVHPASFWHASFSYRVRQRKLRRAQLDAIRELDLPRWMKVYPVARSLYGWLPRSVKRGARRVVA